MVKISPIQPSYPNDRIKPSDNKLRFFELPKSCQPPIRKINLETMIVAMKQVPESLKKLMILYVILGENPHMKNQTNDEIEKAIENFVEAYLESLRDTYNNPLEPFEAYSNRMRAEIYKDSEEFKNRFKRGFQILIEELQKKEKQ